MKYIKKFETNNKPEIGDYVILNYNNMGMNVNNFLNNTIGEVAWISETKTWYSIRYPKNIIPKNLDGFFGNIKNSNVKNVNDMLIYDYDININDILEYSHTKEELELKLASNKYNL